MLVTSLALVALLAFTATVATANDEEAGDDAAAAAGGGGVAGFSSDEAAALDATAEKHTFGSDVSKLMSIIVHSLYSKPEVFLREMISNANDALDKVRFLSLTDKAVLGENDELKIEIRGDEDANTLTVRDYGTGMTAEMLTAQLGTIARTGTKEFVQKHAEYSDTNLIGQFGVGFYSVFLVADSVTVVSKHNDDEQHVWRSTADGSFTVSKDPRGNTLGRGTEIILSLKEDAAEYAKVSTIKELVKRYSEFITFPIYAWDSHEETNDVELTDEEVAEERAKLVAEKRAELAEQRADDADVDEESVDLDAEDGAADADATAATDDEIEIDEDEIPKTRSETNTVFAWEKLNEVKPLWTRPASEIKPSEYKEFYKSAMKEYTDPARWTHFAAEGEIEFKALLYIPSAPPSGMFEGTRKDSLKLYVRRVFITDDFTDILPKYLAFLRGLVDSDDLPLNVSREQLQQSKVLKLIKKRLVRKAIAMIQQLKADQLAAIADRDADEKKSDDDDADAAAAEDKDVDDDEQDADDEEAEKPTVDCFDEFYKNYATSIKLGVIEDSANRARLSKLLKFHSSTTGESTFLDQYVERMVAGQDEIYYLGGESATTLDGSPLVERAKRRGVEVLYMIDPIDEYALQHLSKYDGKYTLKNLGKEGTKLPGEKDIDDDMKAQYDKLLSWMKLKMADRVEKAVLSARLTTSPSAIVTSQWGYSARQEQIIKSQALGDPSSKQGFMMNSKRTIELNPIHPIVQTLNELVAADENDEKAVSIAETLFDTALLTSGFTVENTAAFASRVNQILADNLSLDSAVPDDDALAALDAQDAASDEPDEDEEMEDEQDEVEEEEEEVVADADAAKTEL